MIKYNDIDLHTTIRSPQGNKIHYFTVDDEVFYEWVNVSKTINVKSTIGYGTPDHACFSFSGEPSMRAAKSCILQYIRDNENE